MSEMKPLLDDATSPDAARLLRSAESDGPETPESAEARTLAAIGLLSSAEIATSSSSVGRVLGSFTRTATFGALIAVVGFGTAVAIRTSSTEGPPAHAPGASVEAAVVRADTPPSTAAPASLSTEGIRVDELPTALPSTVEKVPGPRATVTSKVPARPALEDELAAIDSARGALAAGHPDRALARVHDYHRSFRDGRFTEEAEALEIQALAGLQRRDEAREKGARFLAAHPGSPYERRVRSALDSVEVKP